MANLPNSSSSRKTRGVTIDARTLLGIQKHASPAEMAARREAEALVANQELNAKISFDQSVQEYEAQLREAERVRKEQDQLFPAQHSFTPCAMSATPATPSADPPARGSHRGRAKSHSAPSVAVVSAEAADLPTQAGTGGRGRSSTRRRAQGRGATQVRGSSRRAERGQRSVPSPLQIPNRFGVPAPDLSPIPLGPPSSIPSNISTPISSIPGTPIVGQGQQSLSLQSTLSSKRSRSGQTVSQISTPDRTQTDLARDGGTFPMGFVAPNTGVGIEYNDGGAEFDSGELPEVVGFDNGVWDGGEEEEDKRKRKRLHLGK